MAFDKEMLDELRKILKSQDKTTEAIGKLPGEISTQVKDAAGQGGRIDKPTGGNTDLSGIDLGEGAQTVAILDDIKGNLHTLVSSGVALKLQGLNLEDLKALGGTGADAGKYLVGLTDQTEAFKETSDALGNLNKQLAFKDIDFTLTLLDDSENILCPASSSFRYNFTVEFEFVTARLKCFTCVRLLVAIF